jgi:Bacterial TniB protein
MVMTEYLHLLPAYRQYAEKGIEERVAWIRADRWLETADAWAALARLEDLLSYPPRDRMPCLLLYGDTGMGKTKIIRKFLRDHQPIFDRGSGVTSMPVVAMLPAEPVERDVYGELLNAMSAPGPSGDATFRLKTTCRTLMRRMGVRMLIIDEIHAMLTGTYRQQRVFLNVIRFLANDLKVPLICAGTDLARQALLTDAQLAESRWPAFHQHGEP